MSDSSSPFLSADSISGSNNLKELLQHQLNDVHSKIEQTTLIGKNLQDFEAEIGNHLKSIIRTESTAGRVGTNGSERVSTNHLDPTLLRKIEDFQREFNVVTQGNERLFSQPIPSLQTGATDHDPSEGTGIFQSGPTSSPSSASSIRHKRKSKILARRTGDVQFSSEVTENLLRECRQLAEKSQQAELTINSQQAEMDKQQERLKALENQLVSLSRMEEQYKDQNWNLEITNRELHDTLQKKIEGLTKINSELNRLNQSRSADMDIIEQLRVRENEYLTELEGLRSKHENEIAHVKRERENYSQDSAELQALVSELKAQIEVKSSLLSATIPTLNPDNHDNSLALTDNFYGSKLLELSPTASPAKAMPSRNSTLESETLKNSLNHAHRIIASLRNHLSKEKAEKIELKRLLSSRELPSSDTSPTKASTSSPSSINSLNVLKSNTPVNGKRKQRLALFNTRQGKSNRPQTAEGWEDQTDIDFSSASIGHGVFGTAVETETDLFETATENEVETETENDTAFETANDQPTEDDYLTGRSASHFGSEGELTETENPFPLTKPFGTQKSSEGVFSSSDEEDDSSSQFFTGKVRKKSASSSSIRSGPLTPIQGHSLANEFISQDDFETYAHDNDLIVLTHAQYDELMISSADKLQAKENPSSKSTEDISTMVEAAKTFGFVAIPHDDFQRLNVAQNNKEMTLDAITQEALNYGYKVVPANEFDNLVRYHTFPTEDETKSKLSAFGLIAISNIEYDRFVQLQKVVNQPIPVDHIQARAEEIRYTALSESDYQNQIDIPSMDTIHSVPVATGMTMIDDGALAALHNKPSKDDLIKQIAQFDLVTMSRQEQQELQNGSLITESKLNELARRFDLVQISAPEYQELQRAANKPTMGELQQRASALGFTALSTNDHAELTRALNDPTVEELTSKAKNLGLVTLPVDDHAELTRALNEPTAEEISQKATALGLVTLPVDDHAELTRALNEPTAEEISQKATALGLVTLPVDDHAELTRALDEPTAEEISEKANSLGMIALPLSDHFELT
ncbi:hypothetical protein NADFUDRAFT_53103, partial [Nadsonia fulvescens var. elongata DSM 6958]